MLKIIKIIKIKLLKIKIVVINKSKFIKYADQNKSDTKVIVSRSIMMSDHYSSATTASGF